MVKVIVTAEWNRNLAIFIAGYHKAPLSWNMTDSGKVINLADIKAQVCLVDFSEEDYRVPVDEVSKEILTILQNNWISNKKQNVTIISHSLGGFYATCLANLIASDPILILRGMLYIDPTCKISSYREYLQEHDELRYRNFESLPDAPSFKPRVIVKVHFSIRKENPIDRIGYFSETIYANMHSEIVVWPNSSHMLHWDHPEKYRYIITWLIKNSD